MPLQEGQQRRDRGAHRLGILGTLPCVVKDLMPHPLIDTAETPFVGRLWLLEDWAAATVAVTAERPLVDAPPPACYCSATHVSGTLRLRSGQALRPFGFAQGSSFRPANPRRRRDRWHGHVGGNCRRP